MEKGDPSQKLFTRMRLWEFPDQYVVEPTDGSCGLCLEISHVDGSVKLIDEVPECSSVRVPKIQKIFGVIGLLKLLAGSYVLVITDRDCVGSYFGHPIFKVSSMKLFPCVHSVRNSTAEQKPWKLSLRHFNVAERTPGTRMWRRGADSDGFVANFVESEQIIQLKGYTASFVQHGGEERLSEKFANAMQHVAGDDVRYLHFDFHHICGHVHFECLSILYDQIEDFFIKNRYGHRTAQGILADGCNALMRYYLNNFVDGTKQDAVDLLQGHYILSVSRDMKPSSQKGGIETKASFPLALALILTGLFFAMLSLRKGELA
ncbi:hypothetical protein RND71_033928 [Anisodus tanguticus]|uniref:SAC domain-containing protein n=1 Tax=Anisodus tanguticus TaxID=243964 RepID=A0AAE1V3P6_9SOLA|nr:hypothetical protein RND71_033928 [Anisodus tanguticus]